jgi:hypothetical protein
MSVRCAAQWKFETFLSEMFLAPFLNVRFEGGLIDGNFGKQHTITPDVALSSYAPTGVIKGLEANQLAGDRMVSLQVEHNWRTLPYQLLELDFITDLSLDLITGFSITKLWNTKNIAITQNLKNSYWEVNCGLGRILGMLRLDAVINSNNLFLIRFGVTSVF